MDTSDDTAIEDVKSKGPEDIDEGKLQVVERQISLLKAKLLDDALVQMTTLLSEAAAAPRVKAVDAVDRSKVPEPDQTKRESVRVYDMEDSRYERFSPRMRKCRNPKLDAEMARFIRAALSNDQAVLAEFALREREYARATTLEGTTTATSGLSGGTGGPIIPLPLHNAITLLRDRAAVLRQYCTVVTSPALTLRIPKAGVATAAMVAEGATASVGEPSLGSILLSKKKMQWTGKASEEALLDTAFNLVTYFAERAGSAMGQLEDVQICTSNGTAPNITGSLGTPNADSAGAQTITAFAEAVAGTLTYEDVVNIFFTVGKQYRTGGIWMGDAQMMRFLSTIEDAQGRTIFQPGLSAAMVVGDGAGANQVGTIFNRPVVEVPLASGVLTFGDMSYYAILEGERMTVKSSDAPSWTTDLVDFKITQRFDGGLISTVPFLTCAGITLVA